MEKKFTVLRVIATLYKIAGVLVALGTVLLVILIIVGAGASNVYMQQFGISGGGPIVAFVSAIIALLTGGLSALGIYAVGEGLSLLVSLEENTRFTAILLRDRFYPQPQAAPLPPQQPMMPPQQPMAPPQRPMMPPQQPMMPPQQPNNPPPTSYPPTNPG